MTLITQMDCCTMLGIGPKTLRNWLRHATMPFSIHPTDARLKCLTLEPRPAVGNPACSPSPDVSSRFPGVSA
jgi:hypothetical protein